MKMQFGPSTLQQLHVIFICQAGTIGTVVPDSFISIRVRFFSRFLLVTFKKFYRKQPDEFPTTKYIFLKSQTCDS